MGPSSSIQGITFKFVFNQLISKHFSCLSNTEEKDITLNDEKSFAIAQRASDFSYSDFSVKDNIYMFEGSKNPFVMSRVYDINWICEYDMRYNIQNQIEYFWILISTSWYPFDTQTCIMKLMPDGNSGEFIELHDDGLEYLGPMDLTQYFIRTTNMIKDKDGSINVIVVLGRRLLGIQYNVSNTTFPNHLPNVGTILTVYIPTLLLVCISYTTNYYKAFFFEAVVAVNLTCMLVSFFYN